MPFFSAGFTLLETMVALTVIVSAMAGPFSLATRGVFFAKFAKNKLVAVNLVQEGLEFIRQCRDNNVLQNRAWDLSIGSGDWQADVFTNTFSSCDLAPFTGSALLRDSTSGLYSYISGSPTLFTRRITISKPAVDQVFVVSTVTWTEGDINRAMTLQETFYNWH
ncbi:MAG: prepilin-type N-terminal cleavage/methylation domain-containing protein [bacterium]|nr:prepilin-type N-terminal cleavage/methylation domain-containing protein [bacterium]